MVQKFITCGGGGVCTIFEDFFGFLTFKATMERDSVKPRGAYLKKYPENIFRWLKFDPLLSNIGQRNIF
jgi:hypothetical protein